MRQRTSPRANARLISHHVTGTCSLPAPFEPPRPRPLPPARAAGAGRRALDQKRMANDMVSILQGLAGRALDGKRMANEMGVGVRVGQGAPWTRSGWRTRWSPSCRGARG